MRKSKKQELSAQNFVKNRWTRFFIVSIRLCIVGVNENLFGIYKNFLFHSKENKLLFFEIYAPKKGSLFVNRMFIKNRQLKIRILVKWPSWIF